MASRQAIPDKIGSLEAQVGRENLVVGKQSNVALEHVQQEIQRVNIPSTKLAELEQNISQWLGEGSKFIRNEAGDSIFISQDGLRRVRFDFNRPYPHNSPHAHIEYKVGVNWEDFAGQIYPTDVPHN